MQALQLQEVAAYHHQRTAALMEDDPAQSSGASFHDSVDLDAQVASELALLLAAGEFHAHGQVSLALDLTTRLPRTLQAMHDGRLDAYKALKIADVTRTLSDQQARDADEIIAGRVDGKNPSKVRDAARRVVAAIDPDGAADRARKRREGRRLSLSHEDDAMAQLHLELPAHVASGIYARIDEIARGFRRNGDTRSLDQLRADIAADLLLGKEHGCPGPKIEVHVYVDLDTLMGLRDEPAEMAGHGPIPADIAREIAHDPHSTWRRIISDPLTGAPLDVGRERYRPPAVTDEYVRIRDRECRHPGCRRPAHHGDVDHNTPWCHGGQTNHDQLCGLCRYHHILKDKPGWHYDLDPGTGVLTITTPSGLSYTSEPEPLHPPRGTDPKRPSQKAPAGNAPPPF